jgi:hypothetical protein
VHNTDAAIAFLEARAKIDPKEDKLVYSLAALDASAGHKDAALKYLAQAASVGGTNVLISAKIDPRFAGLADDPAFHDLIDALASTNSTATNAAPTSTANAAAKPVKP